MPLEIIVAWLFLLFIVITLWQFGREFIGRSRLMHQIPCTGCQFFTQNYRLECTVNPIIANTEAAINCSDYRAQIEGK